MKCTNCHALNGAADSVCAVCHHRLVPAAERETPQWAYIFATACGIIPVIALGGLFPIIVGMGGAGSCLGVARFNPLPRPLRLLLCVAITGVCWFLFVSMLVAMGTRRR